MNNQQVRTTIDYETIPEQNTTSILDDDIRNTMEIIIAEHIGAIPKNYQELASIFGSKIINWTSVIRTTANRFVEDAVDSIREKLLENMENENPRSNMIVQRFVLVNNRLKIV